MNESKLDGSTLKELEDLLAEMLSEHEFFPQRDADIIALLTEDIERLKKLIENNNKN